MDSLGRESAARVELVIRRGDTLGPYTFVLEDEASGDPLDLTGCQLEARILNLDDTLASSLTLTSNYDQDGDFTVELDKATVATLTARSYQWDVRLTDGSGKRKTVIVGPAPAEGAP